MTQEKLQKTALYFANNYTELNYEWMGMVVTGKDIVDLANRHARECMEKLFTGMETTEWGICVPTERIDEAMRELEGGK